MSYRFEWTISGISKIKSAVWDGFALNVTVVDRNENLGFKEDKIGSIKNIVVSFFLGALLTAVKFITELASGIFEWIYSVIENIVLSPVNIVLEQINSLLNQFAEISNKLMKNYVKNNSIPKEDMLSLLSIIFNPIFIGLIGAVQIAIVIVLSILDGVSFGASTVISLGLSFALSLLLVLFETNEEQNEDEPSGIEKFIGSIIKGSFGIDDDLEKTKGDSVDNLCCGFIMAISSILLSFILYFLRLKETVWVSAWMAKIGQAGLITIKSFIGPFLCSVISFLCSMCVSAMFLADTFEIYMIPIAVLLLIELCCATVGFFGLKSFKFAAWEKLQTKLEIFVTVAWGITTLFFIGEVIIFLKTPYDPEEVPWNK